MFHFIHFLLEDDYLVNLFNVEDAAAADITDIPLDVLEQSMDELTLADVGDITLRTNCDYMA